jgi:hypothetical protein
MISASVILPIVSWISFSFSAVAVIFIYQKLWVVRLAYAKPFAEHPQPTYPRTLMLVTFIQGRSG